MKKWTVESMGLAAGAVVLLLACSVAVVVVGQHEQAPLGLLALIAVLASACTMVLMHLRRTTISRNDARGRLHMSQLRYHRLIESAHEGIWAIALDGSTTFANTRLAKMFGGSPAELIDRPLTEFLGTNQPELIDALLAPPAGRSPDTYDLSYRRLDGSIGWAIVSARPLTDDEDKVRGTLLMLTDITERKAADLALAALQISLEVRIKMRTAELQQSNEQLREEIAVRQAAEDALQLSYQQLRQLTAHLEMMKEEERKRIALDIHDDLGQNLMALKMDVEMLHARAGTRHPLLKQRVGHVLDTIDASIRSVRAIMNDLHPSTLELGLPAALEWLLNQFEKRSGITSTLTVIGVDGELPDTRRTSVIFRIIQEALVNILRHARATQVQVTLNIGMDMLAITIVDDGEAGKDAEFGLRGIKERLDVFGGELEIDSAQGNGSTLSILVPTRAGDAVGA
jgi:PAS domain S-box-containing protein